MLWKIVGHLEYNKHLTQKMSYSKDSFPKCRSAFVAELVSLENFEANPPQEEVAPRLL